MHKTIFASGIAIAAILAALTLPAAASDCRVADPTGTPLNIRDKPNGRIVATARTGDLIQVYDNEDQFDNEGRRWYHVGLSTSAAPDGYAFARYIRCP
jgi:hypothetical protein